MPRFRIRFIGGLILLVILSCLFFGVQYSSNALVSSTYNWVRSLRSLYDAEQELELVEQHERAVRRSQMSGRLNRIVLYAEFMKGTDESGIDWDASSPILMEENRALIRVTENGVKLPSGMPEDLSVNPLQFTRTKGWVLTGEVDEPLYAVYYYRMGNSAWFISWDPYDSSPLGIAQTEKREAIRAIENASGMYILRFTPAEKNGRIIYLPDYIPETFADFHEAEDFGITEEMLSGAPLPEDDYPTDFPEENQDELPGTHTLVIDGEIYQCFFRMTDDARSVTVFMIPIIVGYGYAAEMAALLLMAFVIIAGAFLAWAVSVRLLVIKHALNDEQKKNFAPLMVFRRAAIFCLVGLIALAGISLLFQCIFASFNMTVTAENALKTVMGRLESDKERKEEYEKIPMKAYEDCATAIAGSIPADIGKNPDPVQLRSFCEDIDAEYVIIFDETGKEVISNSPYIHLTLTGGGSEMKDFGRLLKGVSRVSRMRAEDGQTGRVWSVFGAPVIKKPEEDGDRIYWAVLLLVDPDRVSVASLQTVDEIMKSVTADDTLCFSVDPETGLIPAASDPELVGRKAADLGLPEEALSESYMGFFNFNGDSVYGTTLPKDGMIFFYTVEKQQMYSVIPVNTISVIVSYLVLMAVFAVFMLSGYRKMFALYSSVGDVLKEEENTVITPSGKAKKSVDPTRRWVFSESGYGTHTPVHNAYAAGKTIYIFSVLIIAAYILSGHLRTDNSAIAYVLRGNWTRGLNLFAFTNILFLFTEIFIGTIFLRFLIRSVTMYLGTKGETIGRLLLNFASYLAVIIFMFFALSYVGVDTGALAASLGILTFALSLGAQDLVRDILAGLAIVFDGAYQVGDIIEVNGFRGEVLEVGVRSVKIEGRGGNILIIGNRDVKNIINKTRKNSWYPMEINIAGNQDIGMIENLLRKQLPPIGESIPEIISGPFYRGIIRIEKGTLCLSVIAECGEEDYFAVQRKLNRAVVSLFEENGIAMV